MSISGEVGQREVLYPSTVTYQGGLYYEYLGGSLVYARVSYWGEGPNVIYGMRQGKVGGRLRRNGTRALDGSAAVLQEAAGPRVEYGEMIERSRSGL